MKVGILFAHKVIHDNIFSPLGTTSKPQGLFLVWPCLWWRQRFNTASCLMQDSWCPLTPFCTASDLANSISIEGVTLQVLLLSQLSYPHCQPAFTRHLSSHRKTGFLSQLFTVTVAFTIIAPHLLPSRVIWHQPTLSNMDTPDSFRVFFGIGFIHRCSAIQS